MGRDGRFDVVVVGVGGVGSAVTYRLAKRGVDVLGLERYDVPHTMGSSHGYTRVIRLAYHEDPSYVSLLRGAYDCWEELEAEYGQQLLYRTGSVSAGRPSTELVGGSREACERHSLEHETLSGEELSERFPGFDLPDGFEAIYQPDGGFVRAEQSIVAHVERAHAHGAEIHARERVERWQSTTDGIRVTTDKGRYAADRLVVAAGAWTGELIESLAPALTPERNVAGWFQPDRPDRYAPDSFPVFGIQNEGTLHYGIPAFDVPGMKIGRHHHFGETVDPDEMAREPTERDERALREFVETYLPDGAGPTMGLQVCLYTNTPDNHFIVDTLPAHPEVVVMGGFSGHGYKFASVMGEVGADLATDGETSHEINLFEVDRF